MSGVIEKSFEHDVIQPFIVKQRSSLAPVTAGLILAAPVLLNTLLKAGIAIGIAGTLCVDSPTNLGASGRQHFRYVAEVRWP